MLVIKQLTTDIFNNITINFPKAGLYGVVGRNGIGKSTLFRIINREIQISQGNVQCGKVAYVSSLDMFDKYLSGQDYLDLLSAIEQRHFMEYAEFMGGLSYLNQQIKTYSLGMRELFIFLYLLSLDSQLVILDELLDGLDEQKRLLAYRLLQKLSFEKLFLLTSHNLSEVFKVCDEVYLLEKTGLSRIFDLKEVHYNLSN